MAYAASTTMRCFLNFEVVTKGKLLLNASDESEPEDEDEVDETDDATECFELP